jgi:hypothetical protein
MNAAGTLFGPSTRAQPPSDRKGLKNGLKNNRLPA